MDPNGSGEAMEAMALIEIDGLPNWNMVIFHGELLNNQMVTFQVSDIF